MPLKLCVEQSSPSQRDTTVTKVGGDPTGVLALMLTRALHELLDYGLFTPDTQWRRAMPRVTAIQCNACGNESGVSESYELL